MRHFLIATLAVVCLSACHKREQQVVEIPTAAERHGLPVAFTKYCEPWADPCNVSALVRPSGVCTVDIFMHHKGKILIFKSDQLIPCEELTTEATEGISVECWAGEWGGEKIPCARASDIFGILPSGALGAAELDNTVIE